MHSTHVSKILVPCEDLFCTEWATIRLFGGLHAILVSMLMQRTNVWLHTLVCYMVTSYIELVRLHISHVSIITLTNNQYIKIVKWVVICNTAIMHNMGMLHPGYISMF
jgi:hypothetical protein